MKVARNILIYVLCASFIAISIDTIQQGVSSIDMLNEQITTHQTEIIQLKNIIKQQDKTINEQQIIIEKKDIKIKESVDKFEFYINEIKRLSTIRNVRVTAYAPLDNQSGICADDTPTITSTGELVKRGIIAVDPDEIPYGTNVHVPGYGIASAKDTGYAIRNYTEGVAIDVCVTTYAEAINWGVRYLDVIIQ